MAKRTNVTSKLTLSLITGTTATGANKLSSRAFQNVSPDLSDDEILTIGGQIATLQTYDLAGVKRTTTAELEAAE